MGVQGAQARDLEGPNKPPPHLVPFAAQSQLELKYWGLERVRKTVRYAACMGLAAPSAAAICLLITSSWSSTPVEKQKRLRLAACCLLTGSAALSLLSAIGGLTYAWMTSCSARVGNALLFVWGHVASIVYCSFACAISSGLLWTIGLQRGPLSVGPGVACCSLLLLQLLLQQQQGPLGWCWSAVVCCLLLFLLGTQHLITSLVPNTVHKGFFSFACTSHLSWLTPLIAAAVAAAVLLLLRFTEMLLAAARGGYGYFKPPNPGVHNLDNLTADAAAGRSLSLPLPPRPDPKQATTPLLLSQLFTPEPSPRRLGPALVQQRRTLAGPAAAAAAAEAAAGDVQTPRQQQQQQQQQQGAARRAKGGAWLVALWLRGPFLLAALGCCCLALSLLLLALAADAAAAARNLQGPAAFHGVANLLLPQQQQQQPEQHQQRQQQQQTISFLMQTEQRQQQQQQQQQGVPLAPHLLQRETERRQRRQQQHVMQGSPAFIDAAGRDANTVYRHLDTEQQQQQQQQQQQKIAAALLLLAVVLLLPLVGSRLGQWVEAKGMRDRCFFIIKLSFKNIRLLINLFFAHMVLIKRNPEMLIPPPLLSSQKPNAAALATTATATATAAAAGGVGGGVGVGGGGKGTQTPPQELLGPLVHLTEERFARHESQGFLGLAATTAADQQQQQQ
ncbi:hypothetical protein ACSSS7_000423 [Eimeria intestinalis]